MTTLNYHTNSYQTINGTDFPRIIQVYKFRNIWVAVTVLNGIGESTREFKTKKEAVSYAEQNGTLI